MNFHNYLSETNSFHFIHFGIFFDNDKIIVCYCAGILRTTVDTWLLNSLIFFIFCGGQFTLIEINIFQLV